MREEMDSLNENETFILTPQFQRVGIREGAVGCTLSKKVQTVLEPTG